MSESREFNAATVEDALNRAAGSLGVSVEEISYEVLDTGNTGFLGIGARDARILVDTPVSDTVVDEEPEVPESFETEVSDLEATGGTADEAAPAIETSEPQEQLETIHEPVEAEQAPISEEFLDEIRTLVVSMVETMGFGSRVDVYDAGDFIAADVVPNNTALFIGQKGETIDALQYLINAGIYKGRPFQKRVVLDAEGYRQRRVEAIQGMAHRTARRAIREGRTVELPPMNPAERRIVHLFLKDRAEVTTASEGNGESRRVLVSPA